MKKKLRAAILGFGLEGRALFFYLKQKYDFTILDRDKNIKLPENTKNVLGEKYLNALDGYNVIFRSPGIPYNLPEIKKVNDKVSSLTEIFLKEARGKVIGVTGSAGKTTTSTLIYRILKKSGHDVYLVGNIGANPLGIIKKLKKDSLVVLELSSFQLQNLSCSLDIAVLLDIYEEHLDKHKNFKEYLNAKANITKFQGKNDFLVYCRDNYFSKKIANTSKAKKNSFSVAGVSGDVFLQDRAIFHKDLGKIIDTKDIKIVGPHNYKNIMAAALVGIILKVPLSRIREAVSEFKGIPHRLEYVRKFRSVSFYNDSKATNVGSAIAGIDAFLENKVMLIGGQNKNLDLRPLVRRLDKKDISFVCLFGEAGDEMAGLLKKTKFGRFKKVKKMEQAVLLASKVARPGEVVLLSPATASFDAYKNYEERGERFREAAFKLK